MSNKESHDTNRLDMDEWEAQINALLDGELDEAGADALKAQAEADRQLARAIIEAYQLQQVMAAIPVERAPESLREKLQRIPAEQESLRLAAAGGSAGRHAARQHAAPGRRWFEPRWAMALAAVPLVVVFGMQLSGPREPSAAELAQARQDLAVAFNYLAKASRATEREIEHTIGVGMRDPVQKNTVRTLVDQLDLNEERES